MGSLDSCDFYHPLLCQICKKSCIEASLKKCTQCKIIQYCGTPHQKEHWRVHKQICTVIGAFKKESSASDTNKRYFESLKVFSIAGLGRPLSKVELAMLSCPMYCDNCGSSKDLKTCEGCNSFYFCGAHADFWRVNYHDCESLKLRLEIDLFLWRCEMPVTYLRDDICLNYKDIKSFVIDNALNEGLDNNAVLAVLSEPLSRPLTFLFALDILHYARRESLTVHILGGNPFETGTAQYWDVVVKIRQIKKLHLSFIGPEASLPGPCVPSIQTTHSTMLYHQATLETPDLVCAFNSGIHEFADDVPNDTWGPSLAKISDWKVPVVLTSFNVVEAVLDVNRFRDLDPNVRVRQFANPFAGLSPVRDSEDFDVTFSNRILSVLVPPEWGS